MSIESILWIISTILSFIIAITTIIVAFNNKKRTKASIRNATLTKLKCKKDEMSRRENKIYYLIDLYKRKAITKKAFEVQVSYEYEQLKLVYNEYKTIRMELSETELKTEKEDYARSIEHIDNMLGKLVK